MKRPESRRIILHPHELRALREGRLTHLRRPLLPQPNVLKSAGIDVWAQRLGLAEPRDDVLSLESGRQLRVGDATRLGGALAAVDGPFGPVDGRLYVAERWAISTGNGVYYAYEADRKPGRELFTWRSAQSMPREAARFFLSPVALGMETMAVFVEQDGWPHVDAFLGEGFVREQDCPLEMSHPWRFGPTPERFTTRTPHGTYGDLWPELYPKGPAWDYDGNVWTWTARVRLVERRTDCGQACACETNGGPHPSMRRARG